MVAGNESLHPPGWLIVGLPWPSDAKGGFAECAFALAPTATALGSLTPDARNLLGFAVQCLAESQGAHRTLFFSDLTRHLGNSGRDWPDVGVQDWEAATEDVLRRAPGLYLTLSQIAHMTICDASREGTVAHFTDGSPPQNLREIRDDVRAALTSQLEHDWPEYERSARPK